MPAAKPSTRHKNRKREAKHRERRAEAKVLNAKLMQEAAMSSAITTDFSLGTVGVSKDLLPVKPFKLDGTESYPHSLKELLDCGYQIIEWKGRYDFSLYLLPSPHREHRTPQTITDPKGMAYVYLAGRPESESYTTVINGATCAVERATEQMNFRSSQKGGRRGKFRATDAGVSSGTGHAVCPCRYHFPQSTNLIVPVETSHAENA